MIYEITLKLECGTKKEIEKLYPTLEQLRPHIKAVEILKLIKEVVIK